MKTLSVVSNALLMSLMLTASASSQSASYVRIGEGCPGSVGVPSLDAADSSLPFLAETFSAELTNVPINGIAVGIIGLSNTTWGSFALPLDLGFIGMQNCLLHVDIMLSTNLVISGGTASWDLSLPSGSEWIGRSFFQQVAVVDDSIPGLGVIMSNANRGVIGLSQAQEKIDAFDMGASDNFGHDVSLSNQVALIGARMAGGAAGGAAYIYERVGGEWLFRQKLLTDGAGEGFGTAVAIRGNRAIVGAYASPDAPDSGAAFIYEYDGATWVRTAKFNRPVGVSRYNRFGSAVDISANMAVVGAPSASSGKGEIHIYFKGDSGWQHARTFTGTFFGELLGTSVAVTWRGNQNPIPNPFPFPPPGGSLRDYWIAAGAPGVLGGAIYTIEFGDPAGPRPTLSLNTQKHVGDDTQFGDRFGYSLSIDGLHEGYLLVGAPGDSDNGIESGSAYLFANRGKNPGWSQLHKLTPNDPAADDAFGIDVSVVGDQGVWKALVGAYRHVDNGFMSGSAYLFKNPGAGGWEQADKLLAYDGQIVDVFGIKVALDEIYWRAAIVGAPGRDHGITLIDAGSVYPFTEGTLWE